MADDAGKKNAGRILNSLEELEKIIQNSTENVSRIVDDCAHNPDEPATKKDLEKTAEEIHSALVSMNVLRHLLGSHLRETSS